MYQLEQLLGEAKVNTALRSLLSSHAFPKTPPTSQDLVEELYKVTSPDKRYMIDELFKQIIIYDSKITDVKLTLLNKDQYKVQFKAIVEKYNENAVGKRLRIPADSIEIGIIKQDNTIQNISYKVVNGVVEGNMMLSVKPKRIVIDPYFKTIDSFLKDNEKVIE